MYLENWEQMEPVMLMSIINMKLRDEFNGDLDELVKTYSIKGDGLQDRLQAAGFIFLKDIGQFR